MSEQSGRNESADPAPRSDRPRGDSRPQGDRPFDPIGDLQRWMIRSSAKNMRRELEDQVRRTLGGQRQDRADVWDVATTEIPPDVGAAPECQWCPICRAARRMRDAGPGVSGPLAGAGEAVATAVQDALGALDSLLARTGGQGPRRDDAGAARGHDRSGPPRSAAESAAEPPGPADGSVGEDVGASAPRPDSLGTEHGQGGWKPGDRLATTGAAAVDPWSTATGQGAADEDTESGGADDGSDGRGHEPGNRR